MRKIAIVGRPNVGKSTLFNRLTGTKRSITDPTSGVTRDIISSNCIFADRNVILYDTGGITKSEGIIEKSVYNRSISTLKSCDILLFLIDAREWTSEDDEVLELIRPYSEKTILVVNKIDDVKHDNLVWNYYRLGFRRTIGISSSHGRGIDSLEEQAISLLDELDLFSPEEDIQKTQENSADNKKEISISIMGKPNTGKSTLMNLLCKQDLSIVSSIAGTTRDTINGNFEYKEYKFNIVDTAGLRRKSKVEEDIEYYSVNRAIKSIDTSDVVILMIDSLVGVTEQDKKIASLIVRKGCGVILCLNKIDLLTVKNQFQAIEDRVRFLFPILTFAPIVGISAKDNTNISKLLDTIIMVEKELEKRVSTGEFNIALKRWAQVYTPPRSDKQYYKILYGTQVEESPVRFLLFVNKKSGFPETYLAFVKNKIRTELGFFHIPISINLRERERVDDKKQDSAMQAQMKKLGNNKKQGFKTKKSDIAQVKKSAHKIARKGVVGNKAKLGKAKQRASVTVRFKNGK